MAKSAYDDYKVPECYYSVLRNLSRRIHLLEKKTL